MAASISPTAVLPLIPSEHHHALSFGAQALHPSACAQLRGSDPAPISMCSASRISTCLQWPEVRQSLAFPKASCMVRFAALRHGARAHAPFRDAQTTAICHCTTAMAASKCEVARPVTVLLPTHTRAVSWLQPNSEQHSS